MIEPGQQRPFHQESHPFLRPGKVARQDHLDGDHAVEPLLEGAIYDAHAAAADFFEDSKPFGVR